MEALVLTWQLPGVTVKIYRARSANEKKMGSGLHSTTLAFVSPELDPY